MADNNNKNYKDKPDKAYHDSLSDLGLEDGAESPEAERADPIDAGEYVDPEQQSPEVFEEMVDKINRTRAERSKSIWSDEPVFPVEKSFWLDGEDDTSAREAPEPKPEEQSKAHKHTIELQLSDKTKRKLMEAARREEEAAARAAQEEALRRRQRPTEEQSSRTRASRPEKDDKPKFRPYDTEFYFINAVLCILLVFGVGISLIVMKRSEGVIESENREYEKFPKLSASSYFKGEYTEGITRYYTDTIPNREKFKSFSSKLSDLFGIHLDDTKLVGDVMTAEKEELDSSELAATTTVTLYTPPSTTAAASDSPGQSTEASATTPPATTMSTTTRQKENTADDGEWAGNVILTGKGASIRAMPAFYGQFEMGKKYANALNRYKEALGPTVNVFNMYCPLASAYYAPSNIKLADQHDCIKNVGMNLSGVINVDVYDALAAHTDEYIYSRTDHHWQPLGAYYAAEEFAKSAGVPFADISTYQKCKIENYCGTMYTYSNYNEDLKKYPDTFWYYKPDNEYTVNYYNESFSAVKENAGHSLFFEWVTGQNTYSCILGGDVNIAEIKTDVHNGRTLVILKDSYGNALVPFLTHSFEKIYVADIRFINISAVQFIKNVGATDVLFGMSISGGHTKKSIDDIIADM